MIPIQVACYAKTENFQIHLKELYNNKLDEKNK